MESAILRFTWRAENHQLKELSAKDRLDGGASRLFVLALSQHLDESCGFGQILAKPFRISTTVNIGHRSIWSYPISVESEEFGVSGCELCDLS